MCIFGSIQSESESYFPFLYISVQQTKDEYYEILEKISAHQVRYCPVTYFRDEIATVTSWIWVEFIPIEKIFPEIWFYGIYGRIFQ